MCVKQYFCRPPSSIWFAKTNRGESTSVSSVILSPGAISNFMKDNYKQHFKNKTAYLMQFSILTFIYSPIVWTLKSFDLKMIDSCLLRMRAHEWDDNKIRNFIIKALFKNINFIFLPSKYELWLVSRSIII